MLLGLVSLSWQQEEELIPSQALPTGYITSPTLLPLNVFSYLYFWFLFCHCDKVLCIKNVLRDDGFIGLTV